MSDLSSVGGSLTLTTLPQLAYSVIASKNSSSVSSSRTVNDIGCCLAIDYHQCAGPAENYVCD
jgi:hypothetical protein